MANPSQAYLQILAVQAAIAAEVQAAKEKQSKP